MSNNTKLHNNANLYATNIIKVNEIMDLANKDAVPFKEAADAAKAQIREQVEPLVDEIFANRSTVKVADTNTTITCQRNYGFDLVHLTTEERTFLISQYPAIFTKVDYKQLGDEQQVARALLDKCRVELKPIIKICYDPKSKADVID